MMLTPKMLKLYGIIDEYISEKGVSPTYAEMANLMGINSNSSIHRLVKGMEERGVLERMPYRAHAIRLLPL